MCKPEGYRSSPLSVFPHLTPQIKKMDAKIGLMHSCNATAELCNAGAHKQNAICKETTKKMDEIEKKYPIRYFLRKDWCIAWSKFRLALDRSGYYIEISKRAIKDCNEYNERIKLI